MKQIRIIQSLAATAGLFAVSIYPVCSYAAGSTTETVTISATVAAPVRAPAPAPATAAQRAEPVAPNDVLASLQKLVMSINAKLSAEKADPVEKDYAAELAAFDAIIASNKDAKPDDLAQVLMIKSNLYAQVFNDFDNAAKVVAQIKADYPQTDIAAHSDEMLAELKFRQANYLARQALQPGNVFPDFSAKNLAGEDVTLSQLRGKVVLVDFWATWCPPCVAGMPELKAAYEKYHDQGFEIVGISLDQSESALRDFIKKNSITWAQIFDGKGWEGALPQKYGVDAIPAMYLLDADGKIVGSSLSGMALGEQLEKLLKK